VGKLRVPWKYPIARFRRWLFSPLTMLMNEIAVGGVAWAEGLDIDTKHGCWHTTDDGATKEAYSSAVYKETWPASADGAYSDGDTISGDMNWDVSCESGVEHVWVGVGGCDLARCKMDNDGSGTATVVTAPITVTQRQTIRADDNTLKVRNGGTYDTVMTLDGSLHIFDIVPDFNDSYFVLYVDGTMNGRYVFADGYTCNQLDEVKFRIPGNRTSELHCHSMFVADSLDNINVHFCDTLNEDTLSDYTLGGDTNPTYDSTEKAIKLYDDTDANEKMSRFLRTINCPQDKIELFFKIKFGSNDTSTHVRRFSFTLKSNADNADYIFVYLDESASQIHLRNIVGGGSAGDSVATWNPSLDTWYEFKALINMDGTSYLFIDGIEYCSLSCTKIQRFFDGRIDVLAKHDAGEVSEVYVKNILIEDLPTVNAPRSTPPGLLTSAIRPAVEGTYWSDLAGYHKNETWDSISISSDGIYGNALEGTKTALNGYAYSRYLLDSINADILSNIHTISFYAEVNDMTNVDDVNIQLRTQAFDTISYKEFSSALVSGKKYHFKFALSDFIDGPGDPSLFRNIYFQIHTTGAQDTTLKISDIQFLGGPEHDIRGQPYYSSPGIDDLDEWTLSGNTNPTWDSGNSCYSLEDSTASDDAYSLMTRTKPFNPNGCFVQKFIYQLQADDTSTDQYKKLQIRHGINGNNELRTYLTTSDGGTTWRFVNELRSNGTTNYGNSATISLDTNEHEVQVFVHKDYGISCFYDGVMLFSDHSISGTWTDWLGTTSMLEIRVQHDNGEKSHVHVKDIKIEPHPLDIDWFQSNPIEFLTDTLSPSGSEYMDGDWDGGYSLQSTGNPITNGKYVKDSALADSGVSGYTLDAGQDLRRFDKVRLWLKGSNTGNYYIRLQSSSGNYRDSSAISLTADKWQLVEIEDIIDASWGGSGAGTFDPSSVTYIAVRNGSGGASDISIYGLQFLSSEHEKEYFVPQTLDVEWDAGSSEYGSFYIGSGEKARLYKVIADGNIWIENWDIDWLPFYGYGLYGDPQYLYLEASGDTLSFFDDVSIAGACTIVAGTLRTEDDTYLISVGGLLTVKSDGTFGHSTWAPTSDCEVGSIVCEGGTIHLPAVSGGGKLILIDETDDYAMKSTSGSTVYHHTGHIQISTPDNTHVRVGGSINILEVTSGYTVLLYPTRFSELRETNGRIIIMDGCQDGDSDHDIVDDHDQTYQDWQDQDYDT